MKKSKMSRALAVFLAVVMCFTMTTTISFADHNSSTDQTKNLLVFGASTSMGYGLSNFYNTNAGFAVQNNDLENWTVEKAKRADRGRISEDSYPWQLKQYIQRTEGVDVDLSSMCLNGMRTNELHALLDEEYYEEVYELEKSKTAPSYNLGGADPNDDIGFLTNHIRSFVRHLGWGGAEVNGQAVSNSSDPNGDGIADGSWPAWSVGLPGTENYKRASEYVKKEIENADIIVVDICMNNFGTYMAERLAGKHNVPSKEYAENYWKQDKEDIVGVSPKTLELADKLKKTMTLMVSALSSENAQEFLDLFIYCYADCITNFSADIELIRDINPDAKIIAVGVYNTLDGINLILDGKKIDFGDVAAKGFDLVNAHIKGLDKNSNNYYFADVSGGIETFMNQIRNKESFESLMSDESGKFLMDSMYSGYSTSFIESFVKTANLNAMIDQQSKGNYDDQLKASYAGQGIKLPDWHPSDEKVVGTTYLGSNLSRNTEAPSGEAAMTKQVVVNAANIPYQETTLLQKWKDGVINELGDQLPQNVQDAINNADSGTAFYGILSSILSSNGIALVDLDTISDTDVIYGTTYVTFNAEAEAAADMFAPIAEDNDEGVTYLTQNLFKQFVADTIKERVQRLLYNAGKVTDIHLDELMDNLQNMDNMTDEIVAALSSGENPSEPTMELLQIVDRFILYQGVGQHPSLKGCRAMSEDVIAAYGKLAAGGNTAYEDFKEALLSLLDGTPAGDELKELLQMKEEAAPLLERMDEIKALMAVIDENNLTADQLNEFFELKAKYEEQMTKILEAFGMTVDELTAMMDETANDPVKLQALVARVNQMQALLALIDEEGLTVDQLKEALQLKRNLEARMNETLEALGITMDELMAALDENATPEKIKEYIARYEQISAVLAVIDEEGLTAEQLRELFQMKRDLEAYMNEVLDALGITMDDVIAEALAIKDAVDLQQVAQAIQWIKEAIGMMPTSREELVALLQEKLDEAQKILEEKAAGILSDDIMAQIREINQKLKKAIDENDFSEIIEELMPIGAKLLKIGEAVAGLPEYQDAMDAYVESSNIAIAGLEGRVSALEAQIDKLTAKSIDVDLYSDLTFPQNTVTINVVWEIDEDAAGYKLMVNGEEADFEESEDGVLISYALENAQIGEVYQFEVTPYVISSDGKFVYGKTFQQTVVPQVTLKKVALKKVKPAKKAFTAKWKAVANADGYQIYYKAKGKKAKYKNVADPAKLSQKVKKLKSKKYTVKVRAYQTLYDTPYYGAWSKAKKVKVK